MIPEHSNISRRYIPTSQSRYIRPLHTTISQSSTDWLPSNMKLAEAFTQIEYPMPEPLNGRPTLEFLCIGRLMQSKDMFFLAVPPKAVAAGAEVLAIVDSSAHCRNFRTLFKLGPKYYASVFARKKHGRWCREVYQNISSTKSDQVLASFVHDIREGIGRDENGRSWEQLPETWLDELCCEDGR